MDLLKWRTELVPDPWVPAPISGDPDDDLILECCRLGNADYLVTGDKLVLSLGEYYRTRIVAPAEFAAILRSTA